MMEKTGGNPPVEAVLKDYITNEIASTSSHTKIEDDTKLIETGILDSLSILKLVTFIEEKFSLRVVPEDVVEENFETPASIGRYVRDKVAHQSKRAEEGN
jgi:acyl carrier protein